MAVKLKKIKKRNPLHLDTVKWYLTQEKTGSVGSNEIAKEIEGRSALSLGDVQSTLSNLVEMIPLFLKLGQTIKLEGFGSFRLLTGGMTTFICASLSTSSSSLVSYIVCKERFRLQSLHKKERHLVTICENTA